MKKYSLYIYITLIVLFIFTTVCFIPIRASKLIPILEENILEDYGINAHVERLILRIGPHLKVKAPTMLLMLEDGERFAQLDNVKFYIPWSSFFKEKPEISKLQAKRISVNIDSDEKKYNNILKKIEANTSSFPNIYLKEYNFTYYNREKDEKYLLNGQTLELVKTNGYKNYKIKTSGHLGINSQNYLTYDLIINPNFDLNNIALNDNIINFIEQIRELDFHADLIADLKLYKNHLDVLKEW